MNRLFRRWRARPMRARDLPLQPSAPEAFGPRRTDRVGLLAAAPHARHYVMHDAAPGDFATAIEHAASSGLDRPRIRRLLAESAYRAAPIEFLALPECFAVASSGIVFDAMGRLHEPAARNAQWQSPQFANVPGLRADGARTFAAAAALVAAPRLRGMYLLLQHGGPNNFGHWMMDCLPGAALLANAVRDGQLRLLAGPLAEWHRQSLEAVGIPRAAVTECAPGVVQVEQLIVPSLLSMAGFHGPHPALADIYRAMRERTIAAEVPAAAGTRSAARLYVARNHLGHLRHMRNEGALAQVLAARGFVTVHPEAQPIGAQIAAFAHAECIVGPHGSGLFNAVYARPGCRVVEITPILSNPRFWIARLCALMGLRYAGIVVDADGAAANGPGDETVRADVAYAFDADIGAVLRALDALGVT